MSSVPDSTMRWDPYVLADGSQFEKFWQRHLATRRRNVLFIAGRGFDPRAMSSLECIVGLGCQPILWLLCFDNGLEDSPVRNRLTADNRDAAVRLVGDEAIHELPVSVGGPATTSVTSRSTISALNANASKLSRFDDVIVDISAMPRMVALTAVAKLLHDLDAEGDQNGTDTNLHVVTAESVSIDLRARGTLRDEISTVRGFSGQLTGATSEHWPRVWFPILGEGEQARLQLIQNRINPDEICPVIPFPSREPRRGDELITEHRETLFDDFLVEPANILRASEYNPFEAYKQLYQAMDRYRRALEELDGCKAFVSPLSSKLLSIGALLACYDHVHGNVSATPLKVGIPYVETAQYADPDLSSACDYELYSMWIRGEWER